MREYYFANYRLLTDDEISEHESMEYLSAFRNEMPYTHTFTLHYGDSGKLEEKRTWALNCPVAYETEYFTIHDTGDGWAFVNTLADELRLAEGARNVVLASKNYEEMTVWVTERFFDIERNGHVLHIQPSIPLSSSSALPVRPVWSCGTGFLFMLRW